MNSSRPYLMRAIYQWLVDSELTPYIVIDATKPGVQVPEEYIDDGRIVLNISPLACRGLILENDRVVFSARFSGVAMQIYSPPSAVIAIYAKENGRGMVFSDFDDGVEGVGSSEAKPAVTKPPKRAGKPALKVVK